MRIRKHWIVYALIAIMSAAFIGAWSVQKSVEARADGPTVPLRTVLEVISLLKTRYVDDVDTLALIASYIENGTINGMLADVIGDPYTRFVDVVSYEQMQIDTQGEYGGIGITVGIKDEKLTIVAPFDKTPGYEAGLRSGDRIVGIDGKSTEHMSLDEAVSYMRGPAGTELTLTIQRGDGEPFDVDIVRAVIQVPSVTRTELIAPDTLPDQRHPIGYIRLQNFSELSERQMDEALQMLEENDIAGLILDLRDNPGGLLHVAIGVADKFLDEGFIMHTVGRDQARQSVRATPWGTYEDKPLVVLVNGFSASGSEIVAGALQDQKRAAIVGEKTFGKGLVQSIIPLRDGSALSLTIYRYQTAGGHYIQDVGIEPDYVVKFPWPGMDEDEDEDGSEGESEETGESDAGSEATIDGEPSDEDAVDPWEFFESVEERDLTTDPQFQKAVEVLEQLIEQQLSDKQLMDQPVLQLREAG